MSRYYERFSLSTIPVQAKDRTKKDAHGAFAVRALDAIHVASALIARKALSDVTVLSFDDRIRMAADRLGFPLAPTDAEIGT